MCSGLHQVHDVNVCLSIRKQQFSRKLVFFRLPQFMLKNESWHDKEAPPFQKVSMLRSLKKVKVTISNRGSLWTYHIFPHYGVEPLFLLQICSLRKQNKTEPSEPSPSCRECSQRVSSCLDDFALWRWFGQKFYNEWVAAVSFSLT